MNTKMICAGIAIALAFSAWLFRYEIVGAGGGGDSYGMAYRLDRWTGEIVLAAPIGIKKLEAVKEKDPTDLFQRFGITPPSKN